MNTASFIAKRYLFSKKSVHAINIIAGISTLGVLVASGALIVILSVFNGLEELVLSMYNAFASELKIEPASGKFFSEEEFPLARLKGDKRIASYNPVLEEKILLKQGDFQYIATMKGIRDDYSVQVNKDSLLWDGVFQVKEGTLTKAVIGAGTFVNLGINLGALDTTKITVLFPRKGAGAALNPLDEFHVEQVVATGILKAQQELDPLVLVPLDFARNLLELEKEVSAIEIRLKNTKDEEQVQLDMQHLLGKNYLVKNRAQQNPALYKLLNSEKWMVFFILAFVLVIAAFNIVGSLTMLVIDKQQDISVLSSLGASKQLIKRIFFLEGMFISLVGCVIGMLLGWGVCLLQLRYGWVKMSEQNSLLNAYPVAIRGSDFLLVFVTVLVVSGVASLISARLSVKNMEKLKATE